MAAVKKRQTAMNGEKHSCELNFCIITFRRPFTYKAIEMTQLMFLPLLVVVLMALANASNLLENGKCAFFRTNGCSIFLIL